MMRRMMGRGLVWAICLVAGSGWGTEAPAQERRRTLTYAPVTQPNPLKGLVPYAGQGQNGFPHTLEFDYLPLSALLVGENTYNWKPLETLLDGIARRGHQAIFRIYLEYPGKKNVIPRFLLDQGVKISRYTNTNTQPLPPSQVETPDYSNPKLRAALQAFIRELGKRYDGDPRIGFITAGLLGTWGEWHTYPRSDLFASKTVQKEVMDAYESAFRRTPILLRYPAGNNDATYAPNQTRHFGYHDDSFAWATLETGQKDTDWFFLARLRAAGIQAQTKWKQHPIGGEIRPEAWGKVFDLLPGDPQIQNFRRCVEQTHVTWLMDSGMFDGKQRQDRIRRAKAEVARMGYEFHVPAVTTELTADWQLRVRVELINRGVAPFYYDWKPVYALMSENGDIVHRWTGKGKLTGLLPGAPARQWNEESDVSRLTPGTYRLLLSVPNSLQNGAPLRFANAEQDIHRVGWLTLAQEIVLHATP
jgi:hypothetical protein